MVGNSPKSNGRRARNRRRGGDADHSLIESNSDAQGSVSESSTSSQSTTTSDAPGRRLDGKELVSKTLIIQNKRFYVDVREISSGRFVKLAEVLPGGRKSRLSLTMRVAKELRNHLTQFSEFYASLGPASPVAASIDKSAAQPESNGASPASPISPDGVPAVAAARTPPLKSAVIYVNPGKPMSRRRYYIDLKENRRGRYLQISEAAPKDGYTQRYRIAIPAQGLVEMRDTLSGILREFSPSESGAAVDVCGGGKVVDVKSVDGSDDAELPIGKSMRIHPGKVIYFDPGSNPRGSFVKISQVTTRFRTSILFPTETLATVGEILSELQKGFSSAKAENSAPPKTRKRPSKPRIKSAVAAPVKTAIAAA